jgi:hypothetical protein
MSVTTGTFPGIRIFDLPDLGAMSDTSSVVGERAGSGTFTAPAVAAYVISKIPPTEIPVAGSDWISVRDFGAKGDGATDDTAAINAMIAAVPANAAVLWPPGTYKVSSTITVAKQMTWIGSGRLTTTVAINQAAANMFVFNACVNITDMGFTCSVTATSGNMLVYNVGAIRFRLKNFWMLGFFSGIVINGTSDIMLIDGQMFNWAAGGTAILYTGGEAAVIDNVIMQQGTRPGNGNGLVVRNGGIQLINSQIMACGNCLVLAPGNGKTKTGRLWVYLRDERPYAGEAPPAVVYRYSPDRKGEHPRAHLAGFKGFLQADGYSGFGPLYKTANGQPATVTEVACWAHARRNFFDIHAANKAPIAGEALQRIGQLFDVERAVMGRPPQQRLLIRQRAARPLINDLATFLDASLVTISGRSELAKAIRYARSRWAALTRYLDDGTLEISNNAAERSIRPLALGRKNYLFAGSDAGGERAAAIYTLVETAKLNGLDPEAYFRDVLDRIADHPINRIGELLPWNIAIRSPVRAAA